jgi:hypothetical protein
MQTYTFSLGYTKKEDGKDGFRMISENNIYLCISTV